MVSLKLVTAIQRFDVRAYIESRIRIILPCRVVTGNLRTPNVLFVVMEDGVAVLGPVSSSGHLQPEPDQLDVILPWIHVSTLGFRFREPWGPLPSPASKKFMTESGESMIFLAAAAGRTVRIIPDAERQGDLPNIARYTAAVLDRFDQRPTS